MRSLFAVLIAAVLCSSSAWAQYTDRTRDPGSPTVAPKIEHVGVTEHLGDNLPIDVPFVDEAGRAVTLGEFINAGKPSVFVFAYHSCPKLCSMVLDATATGLSGIGASMGKDFSMTVLSIDPSDTPDRSTKKREEVLKKYARPGAEAGLHFLTGSKENIDRVANAAGFEYDYDKDTQQYGHAAAIMLLSPKGKLARYLYGLEFFPNDLRIGLLEASKGNTVSTLDQVILYCYQYSHDQSKYVLVAKNVMKLGGAITVVAMLVVFTLLRLRERKRDAANSVHA